MPVLHAQPSHPRGSGTGQLPLSQAPLPIMELERPAVALRMLEDKWLGNGALLPLRSWALAHPGQTETQGAAPLPQLHLKYLS